MAKHQVELVSPILLHMDFWVILGQSLESSAQVPFVNSYPLHTAESVVLATPRFVLPGAEQGLVQGRAGVLALEPESHQTDSPGTLGALVLVQLEQGAGLGLEEAPEQQRGHSLLHVVGRHRVDFEAYPMATLEASRERETAKHNHSQSLSVLGQRSLHKDSTVVEPEPFDW